MEFVLNKENIELAKEEVLAVVGEGKFELNGNILKINKTIKGLEKRLGLTKEIVISGQKTEVSKKGFLSRRAHLLPAGHPTSLHPKLARALVNLTGAKSGEIVLDPFCGAGGILIEAGLIGYKVVGFDIDQIMLKRAKINLDYVGVKDCQLKLKDATTINKHYDYIVTDLPYGRNSKLSEKDLLGLYLKFFKVLKKIRVKRAIVGLPDFVDYSKLIKKAGLKVKKEFSWYLHKSLTKKIILI
ncbi:methyltransferase domain-containing protein [Candidatus Woesearchaeota archaeon]|nr:methyltransferase domain-containing protein [Candidatus Woesearchaeota archaeon]